VNKDLIELLIDTIGKKPEIDAQSIYQTCESHGYKKGTYTAYLSFLKKAGYVRRVRPEVYAIGRLASNKTIAVNLQRLALHKRELKGVRPESAPKSPQPKVDKLPLREIARAEFTNQQNEITRAVELLKSFGFKVTLSV
jgi:hypothetical protein